MPANKELRLHNTIGMSHIPQLRKDKKLKKVLDQQDPVRIAKRRNVYLHLCTSIMSQQLSVKVADVFHRRFLALYPTNTPSAKQILETPFETLRGIGLSNAKANYIHNVCRFFEEEGLTDTQLHKMTDEALLELLTQIKGVGRWTVEMLLMFTLGREDVFPADDLGIQQSMCKLYGIPDSDKKAMKAEMQRIAENWIPYRTYACRYLWGWKDGN